VAIVVGISAAGVMGAVDVLHRRQAGCSRSIVSASPGFVSTLGVALILENLAALIWGSTSARSRCS